LNWAPQSKVTLLAAIVNLINTIWFVRNQARFNDKINSWRTAISSIITSTSLTGNNTCKPSSNSIRDFILLKKFNICIHLPKIPFIREILWQPPLHNWLKCNIDGASNGNPRVASSGGVFRDANGDFLFAFDEPLGFENAFFAELCGAMNAIEIAFHKSWLNMWLESDSSLMVAAFKNPSKSVPWPLRNRWKNVQVLVRSFNLIVSHICREGNKVADLFANQSLSLSSFTC
jgi:ribonuclease HI